MHKKAAELFLTELTRRFGNFIDTESPNFDPIYVIATAIDPRYKWVLNEKQKQFAAKALLYEVR